MSEFAIYSRTIKGKDVEVLVNVKTKTVLCVFSKEQPCTDPLCQTMIQSIKGES